MTRSLTALPEELLLTILDKIVEPENPTFQEYLEVKHHFRAISLTCRTLNKIGSKFLYRYYRIDSYHTERPVTLPFLRKVATQPRLAKFVKEIEVSAPEIVYSYPQGSINDDEGFKDILALKCPPGDASHQNEWIPQKSRGIRSLEIAALVQFCQDLESLRVPHVLPRLKRRKSYHGPKEYLPDYLHPLLDGLVALPDAAQPYARLRKLEVNLTYFYHGVQPLLSLMRLPSLRELTVHDLHDGTSAPDLPESCSIPPRSSGVTILRLINSRLGKPSLENLFQTFKALETFEIYCGHHIPRGWSIAVLNALEIQVDSLQSLAFDVFPGRRNTSYPHLENFKLLHRLRHLDVDFVLLFGKPYGSFLKRDLNNVSKYQYPTEIQLLPPNLESLKLHVDCINLPSLDIDKPIADMCSRQQSLKIINFTYENRNLDTHQYALRFVTLADQLAVTGTQLNFKIVGFCYRFMNENDFVQLADELAVMGEETTACAMATLFAEIETSRLIELVKERCEIYRKQGHYEPIPIRGR